MKSIFFLIMVLAGTSMAKSSVSGGSDVGNSDGTVTAEKMRTLDCRKTDHFWNVNKGFEINLSEMTVVFYTQNGKSAGAPEPVKCQAKKDSLQCQGSNFELTLPELSAVEEQESSDAGDFIGSMMGVRNKYVLVTAGVVRSEGIFLNSEKAVVCAVDYKF